MSKPLQWLLGLSAALVALAVAFSLIGPFFLPAAALNYRLGMMGAGHMSGGWGMMGRPFGLTGMLVWPVLIIGLLVLGGVWLARRPARPASGPACAQCSRPLEAGWKACPYCGEKV